MGFYINPKDMQKEDWLAKYGLRTSSLAIKVATNDHLFENVTLPVCLVDNGMFTAAAVCYDQREVDGFLRDAGRLKYWYLCTKKDLISVGAIPSWPLDLSPM